MHKLIFRKGGDIGGVMINVFSSSVVGRECEPRLRHPNWYLLFLR
jgi:hypothetical protein